MGEEALKPSEQILPIEKPKRRRRTIKLTEEERQLRREVAKEVFKELVFEWSRRI